ncbi:uncharacterized protein LOC124926587 [Impatiens glandulifera]|uniref:uncharacterized protein LOC124926587 n=1 Tax=Impatiens glandulifera TaxID=253017 RepID=UPI001FB0E319|nr:uncharacterized protein LOC124926587 [Impatiens glandulifera]
MDKHIRVLLNRISCGSVTIATIILILLFIHSPETCLPHGSDQKFPKSTCDFTTRQITSIDKKNKRLWSTNDWNNKVQSFATFFIEIRNLNYLGNHSHVLCVSAGAGHEVMALKQIGVEEVTGVELVDSPPLVSRADPHHLPFFDGVFDLSFSGHLKEALFPFRFAAEMERTLKVGGLCVLALDECGNAEVEGIGKLFKKSRLVSAKNVTLIRLRMTRIIFEVTSA